MNTIRLRLLAIIHIFKEKQMWGQVKFLNTNGKKYKLHSGIFNHLDDLQTLVQCLPLVHKPSEWVSDERTRCCLFIFWWQTNQEEVSQSVTSQVTFCQYYIKYIWDGLKQWSYSTVFDFVGVGNVKCWLRIPGLQLVSHHL